MRAATFEAVSRRTYWIGVGSITLALVVLSVWLGAYEVDPVEPSEPVEGVSRPDPLSAFLFTPLGNAVVLLLLQFIAANLVFWTGVALWRGVRRPRG